MPFFDLPRRKTTNMGIFTYTIIDTTKSGDVSKVQERLAAGDDVDEETMGLSGSTSLVLAAAKGNHDIARLLIKHGANVHFRATQIEAKNFYPVVADPAKLGVANLDICFAEGRMFARLLHCTALEVAAANGDMELVKLLVEDGNALDGPGDPDGMALFLAALHLHPPLAKKK